MSLVDEKSWRLLQALQADARASLKTLAEVAGLSLPATAERIKKMEAAGIIRGYHADIVPEAWATSSRPWWPSPPSTPTSRSSSRC